MKLKELYPVFRPIILFCVLCNVLVYSDDLPFTSKNILQFRNDVKSMFYHAYNGYMQYAIPYDELRPLTCDGHDTWGSYSLTLIDALDTLAVMENHTEFQRVYTLISERDNFESDINVSVFETNIRIVGGLLSAHLLARRMGVNVGDGWPCKGPLLDLAVDAATRLLPAFDTPTGMAYGTVNLKYGVPDQETPVTCAAGVGTFLIEFGTISRLTGDPLFEEVALRAMHALWDRRSRLNLIGNHIDVLTGHWTGNDAGIGAGVDSFFEYLVKGSFLFQRPELMEIFTQARWAVDHHLRHDDWYLWKSMQRGQITMAVFQSLEAFWPGVLTLVGDIEAAQKTLYNYHQVLKQYGFHPEFYSIPQAAAYSKRSGYPLRPEFVESLVYLYQATKDHSFLKMGADLLATIEHSTKTKCGYATVDNVVDHSLNNRMESFFLAETTKYLYLLFNEDHWLHDTGQRGRPIKVGERYCVIEAGGYFFNTEAHPIDSGALACCSSPGGKDFALTQEDVVNLILDPTVFVAGHRGKPLNSEGRSTGDKRGHKGRNKNREMEKKSGSGREMEVEEKEENMKTGGKEEDNSDERETEEEDGDERETEEEDGDEREAEEEDGDEREAEEEDGDEREAEEEDGDERETEEEDGDEREKRDVIKRVQSDVEKVLEKEAKLRSLAQEGMDTKSSFKYVIVNTVEKNGNMKKDSGVEAPETTVDSPTTAKEELHIKIIQENKNELKNKGGVEAPKTVGEGDEPLIKTILEEEKDGNESEYEGSVSGIPWGPRFTAASETGKDPSTGGEMAGVATSISSSKFSLPTESRIVQKDVELDTKKPPKKLFSLENFRANVRADVRSLAANWTDGICPSVLSCPVSFSERFSFKGQMVGP